MNKNVLYVSIPLGRLAEQPHDHTYRFCIAATEVEAALLQEKLDQLGDSELWFGILAPVHKESDTTARRHESEHLLKEIYEMVDQLEVKPANSATEDDTSAKHLGELLH